MTYEDRQIVTNDPAAPSADEVVAQPDTVVEQRTPETVVERQVPETVVERRPISRTVVTDDPVGNAFGTSTLIQTIVWSVVVLVLLVVVLLILHVYLGLF